MITEKIKILVIAGVLILVNSCNKKEDAPVIDKEKIKKEIQEKETEFANTYNARIIKSIGYYADDAISYYQNMPPLVGKDSIVIFLRDNISKDHNTISYTTQEVFISDDANQVVEIGLFKVMDNTDMVVNQGNYMSLFQKRNGTYFCVRDMSTSNMPIPKREYSMADSTALQDQKLKSVPVSK